MTTTSRLSRSTAAAVVIMAPLAGLVWSLLVPVFTGSMEAEVLAIAANTQRFVIATYAGVLMSFLMVPAALAIARLLEERAPVASRMSGLVMAAGACAHGAVLVFQLAEAAIVDTQPDHALATTIVSRMFEHRAFTMVLAPFLLFYIGLVGFAVIILVRSRVPKWIGVLIIAGVIIELASPIPVKARIFFVMLSIAFAMLAARITSLPIQNAGDGEG